MITSSEVRDAFHYLYPDELPELKALARDLPVAPLVINIGAGSGTSGLAFMESRHDIELVTIDIENGDSPLGSLHSERGVMERAGFGYLLGTRWQQIHGDSVAVGKRWTRQVDLVFIDGDHSYEGCAADITIWWPHVAPGGVLVVHDYAKGMLPENIHGPHPKPWPGVDRAVDELLLNAGYEMIAYVDSLIAFRKPIA